MHRLRPRGPQSSEVDGRATRHLLRRLLESEPSPIRPMPSRRTTKGRRPETQVGMRRARGQPRSNGEAILGVHDTEL
jgi:hypothetical protein